MSNRTVLVVVSRCAWTLHAFRGNLIKAATSRGYHVIAIGDGADGYGARIRDELGAEFLDIRFASRSVNPFSGLALFLTFLLKIRRIRPDIVHLFTIKPVIFGGVAARIAGVPVRVATITGLGYAFTNSRRILQWIATTLYRYSLKGMHWTFFQNEDDRRLFVDNRIVEAEVSSIVAGSGVDLLRFDVSEIPSDEDKPLRVLFVGRLLRDKGIFEYIDAARRLNGSRLDIVFELVGGIDPRNPTSMTQAAIQSLADDGVVRWHGHQQDVRPFLRAAHIVVLPSYREGTPRVLLEAAAMCRPIIASDVPGCRDIVIDGHNGWLIPAKDASALADAIAKMAGDPNLRREMGRKGRRLVEERYDEKNVIQLTLDKYREFAPQ